MRLLIVGRADMPLRTAKIAYLENSHLAASFARQSGVICLFEGAGFLGLLIGALGVFQYLALSSYWLAFCSFVGMVSLPAFFWMMAWQVYIEIDLEIEEFERLKAREKASSVSVEDQTRD